MLKTEKLREKRELIVKKWLKKFNLGDESAPEVFEMLSKYESNDELANVERVLDVSRSERTNPVPATHSSAVLVEQFSDKKVDYNQLSPEEKRDLLFEQYEKYEKIKK